MSCRRGLAAAALLWLVLAGCGSAADSAKKSAASPPSAWCRAEPNEAWKRALRGQVVELSKHLQVTPLALAHDGHTFFASLWSKSFSGVARVDVRSNRFSPIRRFPNAYADQASGSFDGRWLVWHEYHSLTDIDDFTTWSWDSHTGDVRQLGSARRGPDGRFWPSPLRHPEARDGYATWTQGAGANGIADVHVVDLSTGRDRVVRHSHVNGSFLANGLVVWPESLKPGAVTTLLAASAIDGRRSALPEAFRGAWGVGWAATDGQHVVYPGLNLRSLYWSPSLDVVPTRVYPGRFPHAIGVPVQISGRYVWFGVQPHSYLADTTKSRYIEIPRGGWGLLDDKSFVYLPSSPKKAVHPVSDVLFYRLSELPPIPPCR